MVAEVFVDAGKAEGLEVWRIENFQPVPVKQSEFGKFYEGDSYLVLNTKDSKGKLSWDVHFWLGSKASQDETGAAAILAVELDDSLGGAPVQHREVQDHESQLFLSHFPSGVRYLPGGINSGFTHVNPNAPDATKRLYQVKGKRNVRVRQVEVKDSAMNKGDCFILVSNGVIYVYYGASSKRTERLKAVSAANQIRDQDHAGRATVKIIDESSSHEEVLEFFTELGSGSPSTLPEETKGGDDEQFEKSQEIRVTLYKVSDSTGALEIEKVGEKPLVQSALNSNDCFILDTTTSGLFVWVGRGATKDEKDGAMKKTEEFLRTKDYPRWTQITRVVEGGEPSTFKEYFSGWKEVVKPVLGRSRRLITAQQIAEITNEAPLNDAALKQLDKSGGCALAFLPDGGDGEVEVFRIENFELAPVEKEKHGMFFGGDSYVVKYRYSGNKHIIYFWLGRESTQDEKTAAALHSIIMDNSLGGAATIVRVVQGCEPRHFNRIFQGKMIIFSGGHASGYKNLKDHDTYDVDGTRLFRIRGTMAEDVRAVQLPESASSLNSDDVFFLETPSVNYLWLGKGSNEDEQNMARNLPLMSNGSPIEINEGEEPPEFWSALGGSSDYTKDNQEVPVIHPQLFHFSVDGKLDEIFHYKKQDLDSDDVFVLKSGDEVYVWIGRKTSTEEREAAKNFCQSSDAGVCILVHEGHEPRSFASLFENWDD